MLTIADIEAARERIRGGIYESPCVESILLSQLTGAHIHCKLDYLQRTGSFKERGARNALLCQLTADRTGLPVVAGPVEATAIGNVLVQARALGAAPESLEELRALVRATHELREYRPRHRA